MPTTREETAGRSGGDAARRVSLRRSALARWLVPVVVAAIIALVAGAVMAVSLLAGNGEAQAAADQVMEAWATGDQTAIDAIYAEDVRMVIDNETLAENRTQITDHITFVIELGNTYRRVGPVSEYVTTDGDLYVSLMIEGTAGTGHPEGVPIVGFLRVRDGQVIRHVFMHADAY